MHERIPVGANEMCNLIIFQVEWCFMPRLHLSYEEEYFAHNLDAVVHYFTHQLILILEGCLLMNIP